MKNKHINQVRSLLRESQNPEYGNGSIELLSALLYAARHPSKKLACVDNAIVGRVSLAVGLGISKLKVIFLTLIK